MLQVNKKLKYLNLSNNTAFGTEAQYIFIGLQHNTTLVHLDLANIGMECTVETITALNKMLQMNKTLTYLNLSYNRVANCNIFLSLQLNKTLVHLSLQNTDITSTIMRTGEALTKMLQINKALTHLNLSYNSISDLGAQSIFKGLQHNNTLVNLNLKSTEITTVTRTAEVLTKMLQLNKALTHLNLSYNSISDLGAQSIFKGLQHNNTLVHFNLERTGIGTVMRTAEALIKMLQLNKALTHLNLSYNSISDLGAQSIFKGLQHNNTLVQLNLHCTRIADEGAVHIAQLLLNTNCSLQTLDISSNPIGHKGLTHIAMSLESNANLITINIADRYNILTAERKEAIHRIREQNKLPRITIA